MCRNDIFLLRNTSKPAVALFDLVNPGRGIGIQAWFLWKGQLSPKRGWRGEVCGCGNFGDAKFKLTRTSVNESFLVGSLNRCGLCSVKTQSVNSSKWKSLFLLRTSNGIQQQSSCHNLMISFTLLHQFQYKPNFHVCLFS